MTAENFAYWLQGFFELQGVKPGEGLSPAQVNTIREHLALAFTKVTGGQSPSPPPWTPASPWTPQPLPFEPYPWPKYEVTCSVSPLGQNLGGHVTVTDDPEAGFDRAALTPKDLLAESQYVAFAERFSPKADRGQGGGTPFAFAPTQVGGFAVEGRLAYPTGGAGGLFDPEAPLPRVLSKVPPPSC